MNTWRQQDQPTMARALSRVSKEVKVNATRIDGCCCFQGVRRSGFWEYICFAQEEDQISTPILPNLSLIILLLLRLCPRVTHPTTVTPPQHCSKGILHHHDARPCVFQLSRKRSSRFQYAQSWTFGVDEVAGTSVAPGVPVSTRGCPSYVMTKRFNLINNHSYTHSSCGILKPS